MSSREHVVRAPMDPALKEQCYERLRAGMRPAHLSTALKEQKAASERGLQDLAKGNHDGVPSASICRRLMKEVLAEKDFADDPYEDLAKACAALDKKYGDHCVFTF